MEDIKKIYIIASLLLFGAVFLPAAFAKAQSLGLSGTNQACYTLHANLGRGSLGQDVFNLQSILIKENLLHVSQPTRYFGSLTFGAVVAFQEKYASEILAPLGLSHGTGHVGLSTRAKLNALYGCGNQSPAISGVSGPAALNVNQIGTWTISASDPENGALSYSVIWGDEVTYIPMMNGASHSISYNQTTTFTHTYSNARMYAPVFYVKDNAGNTASTSISVNVGNVSVNQPAINYIQPSYGVIGASATIVGSGFTPTGNKIKFGSLGSENNPSYNLNSSDGRTLTFTVPSSDYVACQNFIPACMIATIPTQPGNYNVSVINANGTSNQIYFTVTATNVVP